MLIERIARCFGRATAYDRSTFQRNVASLEASLADVLPYLAPPGDKPYGRKLIYSNEQVEVMVMNWNPGHPCLPHDHGESVGWVQVLSGAVEHTLCRSDPTGPPLPTHTTIERASTMLFAPAGMVHMMCALKSELPTVTLHFYSPPISGMRVFDLENGAACVVADDCGAWWPDPPQLVKLLPAANPAPAAVGYDARAE
jgi:cysteine dioxygenase